MLGKSVCFVARFWDFKNIYFLSTDISEYRIFKSDICIGIGLKILYRSGSTLDFKI